MKKIIFKLVLLLMAFAMLLAVEQVYNKSSDTMEYLKVYVANEKLKTGQLVNESMFKAVEIPKHLASNYIIKEPLNGFTLTDFEIGEFIYSHQISEKSPIALEETQRMITVKCNIVEGNGWGFDLNESIDLVMILPNKLLIIEDAIVCRILDENMKNDSKPVYVSLIVSEDDSLKYFQNLSKAQVYISKKQ